MQTNQVDVNSNITHLLIMSDLHSFAEPLPVLDERIAEHGDRGQAIIAGDSFCAGPDPVETIEWIRSRAGEFVVLGNHDEVTLQGSEGEHPAFTEAGAYQRLNEEQIEYLRSLSQVLELTWHGKRIRVMHGHCTCAGEGVSWMSKPSEMIERFADPAMDLVVTAHTHFPFVAERDGCLVANCGAVSGLLLGLEHEDGHITSWGDEDEFTPPSQIYSTYLSVTEGAGKLSVEIEQFDYDRAKSIRRLEEEGEPNLERRRRWLMTGVYGE